MKTRVARLSVSASCLILFTVGALFLGLMLALGGCFPESEYADPVPQQESSMDIDSQEGGRALVGAEIEDFGPETAEAVTGARSAARYDRKRAQDYVERYALSPNRRYAYCGDWNARLEKTPADCTNFASQMLWYAGLPLARASSAESGWWYRSGCNERGSSKSWRTVNGLLQYLLLDSGRAELVQDARRLQVGDLIFYRLRREEDGYSCDGNLFNHTVVVSGKDGDGEPLVSYHSNEAHRVRWNVRNGSKKALGEACATAFVHIRD